MTSLPSYREATERLDWLRLVAPYCCFRDYTTLCLVSRRFRDTFTRYLWQNLLHTAKLSGLDPGDELAWWLGFAFNDLARVSDATRSLVRILDARFFAKSVYNFSLETKDGDLGESFRHASNLLPNISAILVDGHTDLDLAFLTDVSRSCLQGRDVKILSMPSCGRPVPNLFYMASALQSLVYLDMSDLPGSISPLLRSTTLPSLRILKLRGREIDDVAFHNLLKRFRLQLWSLDVDDNRITDDALQQIEDFCLSGSQFRTDVHHEVEGTAFLRATGGSRLLGSFISIQESDSSASFCHPERYFVDAPAYTASTNCARQGRHDLRSDGSAEVREDSAEAAVRNLSMADNHDRIEEYKASEGLTHLRLTCPSITAFGIQRLLYMTRGQIEDLACTSPTLLPAGGNYRKAWPPGASLRGMLGIAHCFRPVISSNLRALRLHHSIVTNIPSLEADALSPSSRVFLAETVIRRRADLAWPQAFRPDLNPRLTSLTLTCLPRRSSGPLITRIIQFLELLSVQERTIQDISRSVSSRRGPRLLKGLRHLHLEFEAGIAVDEDCSLSPDLSIGNLEDGEEEQFSFFDFERKEEPILTTLEASRLRIQSTSERAGRSRSRTVATKAPATSEQDNMEYVTHHDDWNGKSYTVEVWIGRPGLDESDVLKCYRRLVLEFDVRDGLGPVTPAQIRAGAPQDSFVYHVAWSAAVMPRVLEPPSLAELSGMRDVLSALRSYRSQGRASFMQYLQLSKLSDSPMRFGEPHYFWTGRLEISAGAVSST